MSGWEWTQIRRASIPMKRTTGRGSSRRGSRMSPARKSWRRSVGRGSVFCRMCPLPTVLHLPPGQVGLIGSPVGAAPAVRASGRGDHARTGHHGERPQASGAAHLRGIRRQPQGSRVRGLLQDGELRRIRGPPAAAASRPARVAARQDRTHRSDPTAPSGSGPFGKRLVVCRQLAPARSTIEIPSTKPPPCHPPTCGGFRPPAPEGPGGTGTRISSPIVTRGVRGEPIRASTGG